jgi:hypothetical protein
MNGSLCGSVIKRSRNGKNYLMPDDGGIPSSLPNATQAAHERRPGQGVALGEKDLQ